MAFWNYATFLILCTMFLGVCSADYDELEAMRMNCPSLYRCNEYSNEQTNLYRNCDCDSGCTIYRQCCMDAEKNSSAKGVLRSDLECLKIGFSRFKGVYAVTRCDDKWTGPLEIKEKCEGPTDFSDPVSAAPAMNPAQRITYKNLYCAECNHAEKESLKSFHYEFACTGLWPHPPMDDILKGATYNHTEKKWGVSVWWEGDEEPTIQECSLAFQVPADLSDSVRSCWINVVSDCAQNWTDPIVRKACRDYTFVVYDGAGGYRNPHCAICNHRPTSHLFCPRKGSGHYDYPSLHGIYKRSTKDQLYSFLLLLEFGNKSFSFDRLLRMFNECPEGQMFDSFFRKCRKVTCALPGYVLRNNKCVKENS